MKHEVMILDYSFHGPITCFIKIQGIDARNKQSFEGFIRMVDGIPYGDLLIPDKSGLSLECIQYVKNYICERYEKGYFS
ncbi:hypothetical protein ACWV26_10145 [Rummeliibacillus sp. JY-2-4R]